MSDLDSLICRRCGHREELIPGVASVVSPENLFGDYDALLRAVRDKTIARRAHLFWKDRCNSRARLVEFRDCIYHCPRCHRLSCRTYFRLSSLNLEYEPDYLCPDCRSLLDPILPERMEDGVGTLGTDRPWRCTRCQHLNGGHGAASNSGILRDEIGLPCFDNRNYSVNHFE